MFCLSPNQMLSDVYHVTNEAVFFEGEFGELNPIFIDGLISLTLHLDS